MVLSREGEGAVVASPGGDAAAVVPRIGVVVVTMGDRPREVEALLASVER
ncbi:hypothetical protein [Streptomyces cacaoi]|uniref:Uncharacterized protein n=1 Tax=Streptomyces cacaoi TaxID=1898 RepID=A0A4Y3R060_STRCI|nr:hypothetical protein [Streptomyces cacaoi]GEB51024.1 hypothetical protein SCA03_35750 [Streptomyces cacaoi]